MIIAEQPEPRGRPVERCEVVDGEGGGDVAVYGVGSGAADSEDQRDEAGHEKENGILADDEGGDRRKRGRTNGRAWPARRRGDELRERADEEADGGGDLDKSVQIEGRCARKTNRPDVKTLHWRAVWHLHAYESGALAPIHVCCKV